MRVLMYNETSMYMRELKESQKMKAFFKRRVKIFGVSVPTSLIVILALTSLAIAGFLAALTGTVEMTARSGPDVTFANLACNQPSGEYGTITTCDLTAGVITVAMTGVDQNTQLKIAVEATNNGSGALDVHWTSPSLDGISRFDCQTDSAEACDGDVLNPAETEDYWWYVETGNIVADQHIAPLGFTLEFED
jgi:hypothetical protein